MRTIADIHVFEDEAFLHRIARWSLAVLGAGCAVVGATAAALRLAAPDALDSALAGLLGVCAFDGFALVLWLGAVAVGTCASLAVHELVHGAFMRALAPAGARITFGANWKKGMLYACAEDVVFTRRAYRTIALAPSVAVTLLALVTGAACGNPVAGIAVGTLHLSGCTGDWGYVARLAELPQATHVEDTAWGVAFLADDGSAADDGAPVGAAASDRVPASTAAPAAALADAPAAPEVRP